MFSPVVTLGSKTTVRTSSAASTSTSPIDLVMYPVLETTIVYFFPFSSCREKTPSIVAITDRFISVTIMEAPGIGSLLLLMTLPLRTTVLCAIEIAANKMHATSENDFKYKFRIYQIDFAKLASLHNRYVKPILTNCIPDVKPMLSVDWLWITKK